MFPLGPYGPEVMSGGAAAGDLDGDGDADLVVLRGETLPAVLRNDAGVFTVVATLAAPVGEGRGPNGAVLADLDGDGDLDVVLGGIDGHMPHAVDTPPRLFRNDGGFVFADATPLGWLAITRDTWSPSCGDYDGDGRLDVFLAHWSMNGPGGEHLWRNDGGLAFSDVGDGAGVDHPFSDSDAGDHSFTATFVDLDLDGWQDLLVATDFGNSQVFRNEGNGAFQNVTDPLVITDENGMGSAVGDVDGDLDLDWFVSSVYDADGVVEGGGNWGVTGNRLYRNDCDPDASGACTAPFGFTDDTTHAGVRDGSWGWGSCLADLDLDGDLDLFHVNGFPMSADPDLVTDPSRLFVNQGDGTFVEQGAALGVADTLHGRGVVCFDADGDGDVDLLVSNWNADARLYRNDLASGARALAVHLAGSGANTFGVGARVYATSDDGGGPRTQLRPVLAGSNFLSANPPLAHFGIGQATAVEGVRVVWPDATESRLADLLPGAVTVIEGMIFATGFEGGGMHWSASSP